MDSSKWKQGRDNSISMSFLLIEWIDFSYWTRCVTGSEYSTRQNSLSVHLELTFYSSKVLHRNSRERERERKLDLDGSAGRWPYMSVIVGSKMELGRITRHTKNGLFYLLFFLGGGRGKLGNCFSLVICATVSNCVRVWWSQTARAPSVCLLIPLPIYVQSTCVIRQCVLGGSIEY